MSAAAGVEFMRGVAESAVRRLMQRETMAAKTMCAQCAAGAFQRSVSNIMIGNLAGFSVPVEIDGLRATRIADFGSRVGLAVSICFPRRSRSSKSLKRGAISRTIRSAANGARDLDPADLRAASVFDDDCCLNLSSMESLISQRISSQ